MPKRAQAVAGASLTAANPADRDIWWAGWAMASLCVCAMLVALWNDPRLDTANLVFQKVVWAATVALGLWRHRPRDKALWLCVLAFFAITGLRNLTQLAGVIDTGSWRFALGSWPASLSAVGYSTPLIAASVIVMHSRRPRGDWAFADAWVLGVIALLVGACLATVPVLAQASPESASANLGLVAVLRNTLIIVPLLVISFSDVSQIPSFRVYFLGILCVFGAEMYFIAAHGAGLVGGLTKTVATLGIGLGQSLIAIAALLPSMRDVTNPSSAQRPPWNLARALGMAVAVLAPVVAFLWVGPVGPAEQRLLMAGFGVLLLSLVVRLHLAVVVASRSEARLAHLANHDMLTGLPNRRYLHAVLPQRFRAELNRRQGLTVACCYIDLDNLKDVNDEEGHQAGDRLIQAAASALEVASKRADGTAIRLGGDEFVVLAPLGAGHHGTSPRQLADSLDLALRSQEAAWAVDVEVRASIGLAHGRLEAAGPSMELQLNHLIDQADLAQVEAKRGGGGRVYEYHGGLSATARRRTGMRRHIAKAWELGEMSLVYQPVVHLADRRVYGAESLLRWNHPQLGWVSPTEAVQAAERQGWVEELGLRILDRALADIAAIAPDERVRVGINLAGAQLRPSSVEQLVERIAASGLSRWLWLEITEQTLVESRPFVAQALQSLRTAGVVIAIDDFGTGYCGLDYLCTLPVDVVKLDGVFAREAGQSVTRRRVVELGVQLAQAVGAVTLAEGVENEAVAAMMRELGCTYGQGFAFSAPLPQLAQVTRRASWTPGMPAVVA